MANKVAKQRRNGVKGCSIWHKILVKYVYQTQETEEHLYCTVPQPCQEEKVLEKRQTRARFQHHAS